MRRTARSEAHPHGATLLGLALLTGCGRADLPTDRPTEAGTSIASSATAPVEAASAVGSTAGSAAGGLPWDGGATGAPSVAAAGADGGAQAEEPLDEPPLVGPDGAPLPQTEERPSVSSPLFQRHMALLFRAIVEDDPAMAEAVFFPKLAYEQVKDIPKPALDWKHRLMKAFHRDVHEYHRKLGKRAGEARLVRVDVPEDRAQWMKRGAEGNRIGYWRVKRAQLVYQIGDEPERKLEITSCISWRGQWYVVHLHGFK